MSSQVLTVSNADRNIEYPRTIWAHDFGHIDLEGADNTRDLGGLPTLDGGEIRPKRLIRSGSLNKLSASDIAQLLNEYDVERVIDLRMPNEWEKKPDPSELIDHAQYEQVVVFHRETIGITHGLNPIKQVRALIQLGNHVPERLHHAYAQAMIGETGRTAFAHILDELLNAPTGATLWHCTAGKDRTGLLSVIVERALGVPEDVVIDDYLATNLFVQAAAQKSGDRKAAKFGKLLGLRIDIDAIQYAFRNFYDAAMSAVHNEYGSFDNYLAHGLDFGPRKIDQLRNMYVE